MINPWKIIGGAVIGVGAIAAAPVTGGGSLFGAASLLTSLAGAGTVAAAVGAGAVGAGIGAKLSMDEENEENEKKENEKELAKLKLQAEKFETELNKIVGTFNDQQQYFNLVIAMTAVGMACANADREIADEERQYIEEFVSGVSSSSLPQNVKEKIESLYQKPPRMRQAFDLVLEVGSEEFGVYDEIIDITIAADGKTHEDEIQFKKDWEQLKRIS